MERRAALADIADLIVIRGAVIENRLANPASVSRADYEWFVGQGRVWLREVAGRIAGFSAGDPRDGSIWALFMHPDFEGQGMGASLLHRVCEDLRADGYAEIWLSTDPGTRADRLYRRLGWKDRGLLPSGERKFVLPL